MSLHPQMKEMMKRADKRTFIRKKHLYMRQIRWYTILISEDRADGCENRRMDYPGSAYNGIPTSVRFTFI